MANGIVQFTTDIINDSQKTTKTTYSSDKIEQLLANIPAGKGSEVILGCFATPPTTFVQDDQYYNTADGKVYKATSSTAWDSGNTPIEDTLYASIDDSKIYAYIKGNWGIYGGNTTNISAKSNNIVEDLQGQTNANEDGLYVPLSQKSGNMIDNLTGQITDVNNGLFVGRSAKADNVLQKITGSTNPAEDGLYVEDLNPKINLINQTTKLNKDGVQEYLYLSGIGTPVSVVANSTIDTLYLLRNGDLTTTIDDNTRYDFSLNGTTNTSGSYITLLAGITYKLKLNILATCTGSIFIYDEAGTKLGNRGFSGLASYTDSPVEIITKYNKDTKIYFKFAPQNAGTLYPDCSFISVEAMSYLAIDPLQYVDNNNGTQDTPVGTIIQLMGNNAPKHYLKCDNSEYQIKDYPYLAEYFKKEFGSINKFGGDGTTTFRTPDLRGEFLRGTGINSHANQGNGAAVGTHQDATNIPWTDEGTWSNVIYHRMFMKNRGNNTSNYPLNVDFSERNTLDAVAQISYNRNSDAWIHATHNTGFTTRPTNTSVLYCIKAEPTYFINVIGTTIETDLLDTPENISIPTNSDLITVLNQDVQLSDEITNFDKIKIKIGLDTGTGTSNRDTREIDVSDISYTSTIRDDAYTMSMTVVAGDGIHTANILFSFKDSQTLTIIRSGYYCSGTKSWTGLKLLSVKGIKTTSVVQGGNFGGSGSSNPDCDCGKLTDAQIATAVNETKTKWDT